ncbi:MAG: HEAT repeat domain-containing protein [Verrucomicrobia bacterium]|nr:HEAT repeat domain-containing protein [Verrucomicrobiota bacterium]
MNEVLRWGLRDKSTEVRMVAIKSVSCLIPSAQFELLVSALGDVEASIRALAALALGKLKDSRCLEALLKVSTIQR